MRVFRYCKDMPTPPFGCSIASDFVVLVLSPPRRTVLSETVLVLDGCLACVDAYR
jgi:hypothetical protein